MHIPRLGILRARPDSWIQAVVLCLVLAQFVLALFVVLSRINYRYELEWMEGASLIQAYRISLGQALYVRPSLDYIPMIYPPLYFYLAAAILRVSALGFLPLRLISFASSLGCLVVLFLAVRDKTRSGRAGLLAAGSFVSTFILTGEWFDIARVDTLFIFLCVAGVYILGKQNTRSSLVAGILFSLAFLTKQTALSVFACMAVSTLLLFRKQIPAFVGSFAVVTVIAFAYLNFSTGGWYSYYILSLPATHHVKWSFMPTAIAGAFKIVAVYFVFGLSPLLMHFRTVTRDKLHMHYYVAAAALMGTSILARINDGAYNNAFLPGYAGLAILLGLGVASLTSDLQLQQSKGSWILAIVWLAIGMQLARLLYDPGEYIPTQADRRAGDALVAQLQRVPGNVFIPYHNYLSLFAGKKTYLHMMTLEEVRGRFSTRMAEVRDVAAEFNSTPFSLIIMDVPDYLVESRYCTEVRSIDYESSTTFYPVTGYHIRPTTQFSGCP